MWRWRCRRLRHPTSLDIPTTERRRLAEPLTALTALHDSPGLVVIDEVQRAPKLFPVLRRLINAASAPVSAFSWVACRRRRIGVEFKPADAPPQTASMRSAMADLRLDALQAVYRGPHRCTLADRARVAPVAALLP